jgi:hypothetical protein
MSEAQSKFPEVTFTGSAWLTQNLKG